MSKRKTQAATPDDGCSEVINEGAAADAVDNPADSVPQPDAADVDRLIARDYPEPQHAEVRQLLSTVYCGRERPARIYVALLRLADGDLAVLRRDAADGLVDYRDVLAAAEYPEQFKFSPSRWRSLSASRRAIIQHADRQQYDAWVRRKR